MRDCVEKLELFLFTIPQDTPYLGALREGEMENEQGYFVRKGNRTVYPRAFRSLLLRLTTSQGIVGWGETYGLVAPKATAEIINDLLRGFVVGRDPLHPESLHDELYDLMRVRGYTGGFYLDALAAIDIALWDIVGKAKSKSLADVLGASSFRSRVPGYVSGLPKKTLPDRCDLASAFQQQGFNDFKFAVPVADEGAKAECVALREELGEEARIACDLHWAFSSDDAISLAEELEPMRPWFLEAPVATEEVWSLREVAQAVSVPIAAGEEWRTLYDARLRIDQQACHIVQPEMGHTGVTQFMRIAKYAHSHGIQIMPHATIGSGIFLAASLQASAALPGVVSHEYQHSVLDQTAELLTCDLGCRQGYYRIPDGPGLGVEPTSKLYEHLEPITT